MRPQVLALTLSFLVLSSAKADPLEDFFVMDMIAKNNAEVTAAAELYREHRTAMKRNIVEAELALQRCGDCPEKAELQQKLNYYKGIEKTFEQTALSVLQKFQTPSGFRGWAHIFGLNPNNIGPVGAYGSSSHTLSLDQVIDKFRKEGVPEKCIDFYKEFAACAEENEAEQWQAAEGVCREENRIFDSCHAGDEAKVGEIQARINLRRSGFTIPEVVKTKDAVEVFLGEVPENFTPPVPPPSFLEGRNLLAI